MKKKEFLMELEDHLVGVSKEDKAEIMKDYEEHFSAGKKEKRTETEISQSLGNPKTIARDIRKELSREKSDGELKSEAIETWATTKKFARHLFRESNSKIKEIVENEKGRYKRGEFSCEYLLLIVLFILSVISGHPLFVIGLILVAVYSLVKYLKRKISGKPRKMKREKGKNSWKIALSLIFNLLIFVWVWIAVFLTIVSFIIAGISMIFAGGVVISVVIFAFINYGSALTKDILFSALFASIGVIMLGGLFITVFEKLMKLFLRVTKKYIQLNMEFVRK